VNKNNNSQANSLKIRRKITLGSTSMQKAEKPDGNYISVKIPRPCIDALVDTGASQSLMSESFAKKSCNYT